MKRPRIWTIGLMFMLGIPVVANGQSVVKDSAEKTNQKSTDQAKPDQAILDEIKAILQQLGGGIASQLEGLQGIDEDFRQEIEGEFSREIGRLAAETPQIGAPSRPQPVPQAAFHSNLNARPNLLLDATVTNPNPPIGPAAINNQRLPSPLNRPSQTAGPTQPNSGLGSIPFQPPGHQQPVLSQNRQPVLSQNRQPVLSQNRQPKLAKTAYSSFPPVGIGPQSSFSRRKDAQPKPNPVQQLRDAARKLDEMAAEFETNKLFKQADGLRKQSKQFWHQARELEAVIEANDNS